MSVFFVSDQDARQAEEDAFRPRPTPTPPFLDAGDVGMGALRGATSLDVPFFDTLGRLANIPNTALETPSYLLPDDPVRRRATMAVTDPTSDDQTALARFFEQRQEQAEETYRGLRRIRVDPATQSEATQVVAGLAEALTPALIGGALGGPTGASAALGLSEYQRSYTDLLDQNVTDEVAQEAAFRSALWMTAMGIAPVSVAGTGRTLLTRLAQRGASGAALNVGLGIGQRNSMSAYLRSQGYDDLADQYHWWQPQSVAIDAILGAAFGAIFGHALPASPSERAFAEALRRSDAPAAALVEAAAMRDETAFGVPANHASRRWAQDALDRAEQQAANDEPIDVGPVPDGVEFVPLDGPRDLSPEQHLEEARQLGTDGEFGDALAHAYLAKLGGAEGADEVVRMLREDASPEDQVGVMARVAELRRQADPMAPAYEAMADYLSENGATEADLEALRAQARARGIDDSEGALYSMGAERRVSAEGARVGMKRGRKTATIEEILALRDELSAKGFGRAGGGSKGSLHEAMARRLASRYGETFTANNIRQRLFKYERAVASGAREPAKYSLTENPAFSTEAELNARASELLGADWTALSRAGFVEMWPTAADIPHGGTGVPPGVKAVHFPSQRRTYFVASNIRPRELKGLILHEIGVHHGMEDMLGKRGWNEVLRQLEGMVESDHPDVVAARRDAERFAGNSADIEEETLAYLIENQADLPLVQSLLSRLRQWLIKTFGSTFGMRLTVDDLRALALSSLRRVAEQARREAGGVTVLSARDYTNPEEIMASARAQGYQGSDTGESIEWLRAIEKGLPMDEASRMARAREMGFDVETPLYHGTSREFQAFRPAGETDVNRTVGSNPTNSRDTRMGAFLSTNPRLSAEYAEESARNWRNDVFGEFDNASPETRDLVISIASRHGINNRYDFGRALERIRDSFKDGGELSGVYRELADALSIKGQSPHVMPLLARGRFAEVDWAGEGWNERRLWQAIEKARADGADGLRVRNINDSLSGQEVGDTVVVFPDANGQFSNIRSRFAAFDPDYRESDNLMASQSGRPAPPFYSAVERVVTESKTARASGSQWLATISKAPGVKREELDWIGLPDFLKATDAPISREDVLSFIRANGVQVEETVLSEGGADTSEIQREMLPLIEERDRLSAALGERLALPDSPEGARITEINDRIRQLQERRDQQLSGRNATRWSQYALPGGENYRELLLRLPERAGELQLSEPRTETFMWEGRQRVEGVQERTWRIGNAEGRLTHWPETYNWKGDPQGERFVVYSQNLQNAQFKTFEEARQAIVDSYNANEGSRVGDGLNRARSDVFRTSHFSEPNILAHVRFNERVDSEGRRTLFLEEVQSDWHQGGRERGYGDLRIKPLELSDVDVMPAGYRQDGVERWIVRGDYEGKRITLSEHLPKADAQAEMQRIMREGATIKRPGTVPDAPFKNNAWAALSLKRMIRWAAENGFDAIAWTRGQHQIERFSLEKVVERIGWGRREDGNYDITVTPKNGDPAISRDNQTAADLAELIGQDAAKRITESSGEPYNNTKYKGGPRIVAVGELTGPDLRTGGHGMRAFYDRILPNIANDIGKRYGARVGETEIQGLSVNERFDLTETGAGIWRLVDKETGSFVNDAPTFRSGSAAEAWLAEHKYLDTTVHSLPITPELRAQALEGMPLFSKGAGKDGQNRPDPVESEGFQRRLRDVEDRLNADGVLARTALGKKSEAGGSFPRPGGRVEPRAGEGVAGGDRTGAGGAEGSPRPLRLPREVVGDILSVSGIKIEKSAGDFGDHRVTIDLPHDLDPSVADAFHPERTLIRFNLIEQGADKRIITRWSHTADPIRGTKAGRWLYRQLVNWALEHGYQVHSDYTLSPSSQRIYESLQRSGYELIKDRTAQIGEDGWLTTDKPYPPVYRVKAGAIADSAEIVMAAPEPRGGYEIGGPTLKDRLAPLVEAQARRDQYDKLSPAEQAIADNPGMEFPAPGNPRQPPPEGVGANMGRRPNPERMTARELMDYVKAETERAQEMKKGFEAAARCAARHGAAPIARGVQYGVGVVNDAWLGQVLGLAASIPIGVTAAPIIARDARRYATPGSTLDRQNAAEIQSRFDAARQAGEQAGAAAGLDNPSTYDTPQGEPFSQSFEPNPQAPPPEQPLLPGEPGGGYTENGAKVPPAPASFGEGE